MLSAKPKAEADNTYQDLIIGDITKTECDKLFIIDIGCGCTWGRNWVISNLLIKVNSFKKTVSAARFSIDVLIEF